MIQDPIEPNLISAARAVILWWSERLLGGGVHSVVKNSFNISKGTLRLKKKDLYVRLI